MRSGLTAIVIAAVAVVGITVGMAIPLAHSLAGCYIDWVPLSAPNLCYSSLWGGNAYMPFYLLGATAAVLLVALVVLVRGINRQFLAARRLRRDLEAAAVPAPDRLRRLAEQVGLDAVRCVATAVPLAITVGTLRPRVLVSDGLLDLLDDDELATVLRHERHHVQRRDPAVFGLARLGAAVGFPLPALRGMADRVVLDAEIAADSAATTHHDPAMLVRALAKLTAAPPPPAAAVGSIGGMLDHRVRALAGRPHDLPVRHRTVTLLGAALLLAPAGWIVFNMFAVRGLLPW